MKKKGATKATEEEEVVDQEEEATTDDTEAEDEESAEDTKDDKESEDDEKESDDSEDDEESEDEDDSEKSSSTDDLDLDAELEKERRAGEPDPEKAKKRFKDSEKKKAESDEGDDDKPLTRKDLADFAAGIRKETNAERAFEVARKMAGSDKEAELIVAKWNNRTFPKNLTLEEQITEAFVITHHKKLIGERNEALRGLKGKKGIKKDVASSHQDGNKNNAEPKLPPADAAAIRASGFSWNNVAKRYEKKLANGRLLVRDPKTKQVRLLAKGQKS